MKVGTGKGNNPPLAIAGILCYQRWGPGPIYATAELRLLALFNLCWFDREVRYLSCEEDETGAIPVAGLILYMFRRHTVKLYPNDFVKAKFELWERQCRWLWNLCLQQRLDAGWGMFSNMLEYKCREVIKINPAYTSQTCSACGHVDRENRCGKHFECLKCVHKEDADLNAAHNILRAGLALRGENTCFQ